MITRAAEQTIHSLLQGFPIVAITGPRQSGPTLAKAIFTARLYVSLEDPDVRLFATEDPRSFLERFPDGAVLDEVQRCPQILSYLQTWVDLDGRMGLFILTGTQQFDRVLDIRQSLAGRTACIELLPFSIDELTQSNILPQWLDEMPVKGGYPSFGGTGLSETRKGVGSG